MLIRTMVLVAFIAMLGETIVYASAALARMSFHARESAAVRSAFQDAVHAAQQAAISGRLPQPRTTCAYADASGCEIRVSTTIATATPVPGATPNVCPAADCTIYMQGNTHVAESRSSFTIVERVLAANGDVMMRRSATVSFRTFATAPYAALVGSLDATLDAIDRSGAGDDGGSGSTADSTLIHVEYRQQGNQGVRSPGDVWRAQDQHPATAAPSWDS